MKELTERMQDDLKNGTRIRLSQLGLERCPRIASHTGVVVGTTSRSASIRVLLDGRKMPMTLHTSYIEPE
jgi:hypothetical protein